MKTCGLLLLLALGACARQPARCERPVGLMPEAPRAEHSRRLVATIADNGACRVALQLPDGLSSDAWRAARDAALASATVAAHTCCTQPQISNLAAWPEGASAFEVDFKCAPP